MKKIITLSIFLIAGSITAMAQNVINPTVESSDDGSTAIAKIETTGQFTIVSFEHTASADKSWFEVNKEIFIQTDVNNQHYDYVKAENISIAPEKTIIAKAGDKTTFKVYFKKIPAAAKLIDIIERAGGNRQGSSFFNFYGVSLQPMPAGVTRRVKVTNAVLLPPPPVERSIPDTATTSVTTMGQPENMEGAMNAMGPMYSNMAKSIINAQLDYYKQPGKLTEIAKLKKKYFDALVKEGFNYDQAIKIITSEGLISKTVQ